MDTVCHFEIPYDDKARAEKFYRTVFGWQTSDAPGEFPYTFAVTCEVDEQMRPKQPGGINGGMYQRDSTGDESATSPVVVISVDSCEQRIKDVQAAGGSLVFGPNEVSGMGFYAQVKDPEGNIIGLWQSLQQPG